MNYSSYTAFDIYSEIINNLQGEAIEDYSDDERNFCHLGGAKILITGAAGSIGSEVAKKIARLNPLAIGLLDINESGLADLLLELNEFSNCKNKIYLTDISNEDSLKKAFEDFQPDYVYHAAAYKHVPIMEIFPEEALRVNIIGTYNVAKLAGEFNSEKFVLISSDKAVYPSGIMGRSKKLAEIITKKIRFNYSTKYVTVRFGNVIGSRGSVSEIITRQILKGGPVTLTHPEMKRYFMTISQAVNLMLIASNIGEDGNLFILDMNESIYIIDLIYELINRFAPPDSPEIKIILTGLRPGERLIEKLMTSEERNNTIYEEGLYRINTDYIDENHTENLGEFNYCNSEKFHLICEELFTGKDICCS